MVSLFQYSLAVSVPLTVLWVLYRCSLSSEMHFKANRFIVWLIYFAGLLLMPMIVWCHSMFDSNPFGAPVVIQLVSPDVIRAIRIIAGIWLAGVVIVAVMTLVDIVRISLIIRKCSRIVTGDYIVHVSQNAISPFSFGRHIVMSGSDYSDHASIIVAHELGHIRHLHSYDMILSQIVAIFCWYNPAAWLLRSDLRAVHEYQADSFAASEGVDLRAYQMFLLAKALAARFPWIASRFNHSKIARRISMMNRRRKDRSWRLACYAIPVIGVVACAVVLDNPQLRAPILAYAAVTRQATRSNGLPPEVEIYVDGVELSREEFGQVSVDDIKSITVNKRDNRIDIFMSE